MIPITSPGDVARHRAKLIADMVESVSAHWMEREQISSNIRLLIKTIPDSTILQFQFAKNWLSNSEIEIGMSKTTMYIRSINPSSNLVAVYHSDFSTFVRVLKSIFGGTV